MVRSCLLQDRLESGAILAERLALDHNGWDAAHPRLLQTAGIGPVGDHKRNARRIVGGLACIGDPQMRPLF